MNELVLVAPGSGLPKLDAQSLIERWKEGRSRQHALTNDIGL